MLHKTAFRENKFNLQFLIVGPKEKRQSLFSSYSPICTKAIQKVKNVCAYSLRICFIAADHWFLLFSVMLKSCLMQLYVGPYHMVSAEIAVALAVPIENPADCEVRGVISFLQADEILGYLAEEASSRVELFCCTTTHVRILPGRHKPYCVSNSIGTSSSILRTARTWHLKDADWITKWYEEGLYKLVPRYDKWLNVGK